MQEKGRKAAIKGYAYESIVLGMLMEKYGDVSRAGLPMAFYDLTIKIDKATIYAQVKTCSKRIRFTGGSGGKEYVQSTDTSDVVIGIRLKKIQTFELYFVPTVLIEHLNQKSICSFVTPKHVHSSGNPESRRRSEAARCFISYSSNKKSKGTIVIVLSLYLISLSKAIFTANS